MELAWLEWLQPTEAEWCRIHDFVRSLAQTFCGQGKRIGDCAHLLGSGFAHGYQGKGQQAGGGMASSSAQRRTSSWPDFGLEARNHRPAHGVQGYAPRSSAAAAQPGQLGATCGLLLPGRHRGRPVRVNGQGYLDGDSQARYVMRQPSHTVGHQRLCGRLSKRLEAVGEGSLRWIGWSRARLHQERHLRRRACRAWQGQDCWSSRWTRGCSCGGDRRPAAAKQLAVQDVWGDLDARSVPRTSPTACSRPTRAQRGWDTTASTPRPSCRLPCDLRERFIDLLIAFEASLVKPSCWVHMMVLRPKPSEGLRTTGLTVSPLRVLSRLRRLLAQQWEKDHDAGYFWGCQGKACDGAAWAHSVMVAAANGRHQSVASLLLDLAKFYEHMGHDHLWEEGTKTQFTRGCLLPGALRTKVGSSWRQTSAPPYLFLAFGTILSRMQRRHNGSQLDVGDSPRDCCLSSPQLQSLECG